MKKKLAFLVTIVLNTLVFTAVAQTTDKCEKQFEIYEEKVKSRSYTDAQDILAILQKDCPKYDTKIYTYAEKMYKYKIESSRTPETKRANIDTLLVLYADYEKNFPGNGSLVRKALLLKEQQMADDDEVYKMLDTFFAAHKKKFTDYDALQTYFNLYLQKYESGKTISQKEFVEKYATIAAQVAYAQNKLTTQKATLLQKQETAILTDEEKQLLADADPALDALDAVADNISIMASKHFSCEVLSEYYARSYNDHKADIEWLGAVADVMYNNKCYNNEVLYNAATAIQKTQPTAQSNYRLGKIELKRGNTKDAIYYFEKSVALDNDIKNKANKYYEIASVYRNIDKKTAKQYALKAAETNPEFGKPYIMLAQMYASVTSGGECNLTDFQRKALVFLALEATKKAEEAESRYKTTAAAMAERYKEKLPSKSEAKAAGYRRGDEVTFGCWINETIKLPKL
ncbi:tetratricopeptide repeat protein [Flavobacterium litorale]|uniref:Tetratricopeptide repeat-containing protein n=1 Tax=Flavobacterium litorale TaxID=2856519 RepID=A0ABX8V976_9FLAO|nr:hypothetical protein [Flavobacterium litorale]QYJ69405.1 hypothetical protein K1I41_05825 [Flavobacterium litorale]